MSQYDFDVLALVRLEVEAATTGLANLVPNPSGDLGAWGWITPVATSNLVSAQTEWGGALGPTLRYSSPNPSAASYFYTEPMPLTTGQYVGAKWHVTTMFSGYYRARFQFLDAALNVVGASAQTAYAQAGAGSIAAQLAPASTAFVRLRFDTYSNTSAGNPAPSSPQLELRDVVVAKAATAAGLGVTRTNLNNNPSFESNVDGYEASEGVTCVRSTAQAAVGVASMAVTFASRGGYVYTSGALVAPGRDYTFQFRSRAATTPRTTIITMEWFDSDGASIYMIHKPGVLNTTTGWVTTAMTGTAPGNAYSLRVFFGVNDSAAGEVHYFDALVIEDAFTALPFITGTVNNQYLGVVAHGWVNVLGPTHEIGVTREGLNVGTITATIRDMALHPATADTIRPGRKCRLLALGPDDTWRAVFTGKMGDADVDYDHLDVATTRPAQIARIQISATDNTTPLANARRPQGVGTIAELPYVLEGCGVPWSVNGSGNQVAVASVVSTNDNATALDQIGVTRDSNLATAWVDRNGVLVARDAGLPASPLIRGNWSGEDLNGGRPYGGVVNPTATWSTVTYRSAPRAGQLTANAGTTYMGFWLDRVVVVPGQRYRFTGWVRSAATTRQTGRYVAWRDATGWPVFVDNTATAVTTQPASTAAGWTQITYDVTAPAGARFAEPGLHVISPAAGEIHYFDDFTFYPILDEDSYNPDVRVSYSTKSLINEANIKSIEWDPADPTKSIEVPYGPYRSETSIAEWGRYSADFTVHGLTPAQIATLGANVLARNATPTIRLDELTLPVAIADHLGSRAVLDLYSIVRVENDASNLAQDALVTGLKHRITPDGWLLTLTFADTTSVATPQQTPPVQSGDPSSVASAAVPASSANWTSSSKVWREGRVRSIEISVTAVNNRPGSEAGAVLAAGDRPPTARYFWGADAATGAAVALFVDTAGGIGHIFARNAGQATVGAITYLTGTP